MRRSPAMRVRGDVVHVMMVVHDVVVGVMVEDVRARAEHPRVIDAEADAHRRAIDPDVARRHRGQADVVVAGLRHAPDDPGVRVLATGDPRPAHALDPHPTAVMEDHPAERVVAHPDVFVVGRELPVARGDVRREVRTDDLGARDPNASVRGIVAPRSVRLEMRLEVRERARIGVGVLLRLGRCSLGRSQAGLRVDSFGRSRCVRGCLFPRRLSVRGSGAQQQQRCGDDRDPRALRSAHRLNHAIRWTS